MRNMITGGMSEREARAMLLERGIFAFKCLAGMIPQKTDLIDNLPTFSVSFNNAHYYPGNRHITLYKLWLRCDEPMCNLCADNLELFLQPNDHTLKRQFRFVHFIPHLNDNDICCLCGNVCYDVIPF